MKTTQNDQGKNLHLGRPVNLATSTLVGWPFSEEEKAAAAAGTLANITIGSTIFKPRDTSLEQAKKTVGTTTMVDVSKHPGLMAALYDDEIPRDPKLMEQRIKDLKSEFPEK